VGVNFPEPAGEIVGDSNIVRIYCEVSQSDMDGEEGGGEKEAEEETMAGHELSSLGGAALTSSIPTSNERSMAGYKEWGKLRSPQVFGKSLASLGCDGHSFPHPDLQTRRSSNVTAATSPCPLFYSLRPRCSLG
jgi:hypothetical protein